MYFSTPLFLMTVEVSTQIITPHCDDDDDDGGGGGGDVHFVMRCLDRRTCSRLYVFIIIYDQQHQ